MHDIPAPIFDAFSKGMVIPAMPLALDENRRFDEKHQRALVRYYIDAGSGGIAAAVHSTQFEIREAKHGLLNPVLSLVSEEMNHWGAKRGKKPMKIAGICGATAQAVNEAAQAKDLGYHAGLLSLAAMGDASIDALIAHAKEVGAVIPVIGFYLQPAVGGRVLPHAFWRRLAELPAVIGIKMAPFNRYQTWDVIRAVAEAGAQERIALYTGNDDHILLDLATPWQVMVNNKPVAVKIRGGLLGHWCVWTQRATEQLAMVKALREGPVPQNFLTLATEVSDTNAVLFDAANGFAGCIPGIHEVLRRQGLLKGTWCLNPHEVLSPGQAEELDRIHESYPHLHDDAFVKAHLAEWLA